MLVMILLVRPILADALPRWSRRGVFAPVLAGLTRCPKPTQASEPPDSNSAGTLGEAGRLGRLEITAAVFGTQSPGTQLYPWMNDGR